MSENRYFLIGYRATRWNSKPEDFVACYRNEPGVFGVRARLIEMLADLGIAYRIDHEIRDYKAYSHRSRTIVRQRSVDSHLIIDDDVSHLQAKLVIEPWPPC